jgi:hypothetical protein
VTQAQQPAIPVIGFLNAASPAEHKQCVEAFRLGLRERGYEEGRNIIIEYRWAEGSPRSATRWPRTFTVSRSLLTCSLS